MKKIFFYINILGNGGAERVMVNLAKFFSENGYDVTLITSFRVPVEYPLAPTVRRLSLEEDEIKQSRLARNLSRIQKLRQLCKKEKPDLLVAFMAEPNFRAILAAMGLPVKTLISVRNDPEREYAGKLGHLVGKYLLPFADGCVFQTQDAQAWFPEKLQKKSTIIYNAVKEEFYQIQRTPHPEEIVTCGSLEEQKNHALLLDAFQMVLKNHPKAVLKIYGEGSLRESLQQKINAMGLNESAFLMGATAHVDQALQTANVFVLSSDYEGMPNALMEAMAAGVPCVSTDCPCGGPRELFGEDAEEKLIPCGNAAQMAAAIENVLASSAQGEVERLHAEAFRPEKVNAAWENYMLKLLE